MTFLFVYFAPSKSFLLQHRHLCIQVTGALLYERHSVHLWEMEAFYEAGLHCSDLDKQIRAPTLILKDNTLLE